VPGKSQRKHLSQSKKKKRSRGSSALDAQQQPVSQTYESASQPVVSASSASVPTPKAAQTVARYPYIVTELRRIGILAGIILAILVVLALVLS
jgi:hypothetical protein